MSENNSIIHVNSTEGLGVASIAVDYNASVVWVGTAHKLWRFDGDRWIFFWCLHCFFSTCIAMVPAPGH